MRFAGHRFAIAILCVQVSFAVHRSWLLQCQEFHLKMAAIVCIFGSADEIGLDRESLSVKTPCDSLPSATVA